MISPTPGRVLWFHPAPTDFLYVGDAPLAAIVARVWTETCVNLTVFDANGLPHGRTSVLLYQGAPYPRPAANFAEWMPYQLGQAQKAQALESQLAGVPAAASALETLAAGYLKVD